MSVEQWARPATPDELARHPAAAFGKRAQLAGWHVDYRYARGPWTVKRRPAEPNEQGKYALVEVTTVVDSIAVRARHPDGRILAGVWIEGKFESPGYAASPRTSLRLLGIRALTRYLTEIEEETVEPEEKERRTAIEMIAEAAIDAGEAEGLTDPSEAFLAGFTSGHALGVADAGDAYGEGYAAGLAAVANHAQVWVATRRRLGSLIAGDVILGKGDRWWIVGESVAVGPREWQIEAFSAGTAVHVQGHPSRKVDVVEQIATADALAALRELGAEPIAASVEEVAV